MKERHLEAVPDLPMLETEEHEIPLLDLGEELGWKSKYDPEKRGGGKGVAMVIGSVIVYDLVAKETISNAVSRYRESESRLVRGLTLGTIAVGTAHLLDGLGKYDPIDWLASKIGRWKE